MIELKIEIMAVNKIKPYVQNAKKHNVKAVKKLDIYWTENPYFKQSCILKFGFFL